ncbi:MAG: hypothetical protein H6647_00110 [Anaerolineales bacterium]|nr:hypothetical protein [Anaerolineales bacterium]
MSQAKRFAFTTIDPSLGDTSFRPMLSVRLARRDQSVVADGLLDSGSMVNVMPYRLGLALGASWEQQQVVVHLAGNLANLEARALLVSATVEPFAPVLQAFAWTKSTDVPLILGQVNFFQAFDVCFFRSELAFEIRSKQVAQ